MYKMGAEQMSHAFYAASGPGTSPALCFSNSCKIINDGDLVILDIGAVYNGYYSDVGTTTIVGKKSKEKLKVLDTEKKALAAAMSKIKPGIIDKEIDLAARKITTEAGFGKNHVYGSCHGVGLQHCEYPFFGPNADIELEEGMFFNVDRRVETTQMPLMDSQNYDHWKENGGLTLGERVNARSRELLDNHKPLPVSDDKKKEITALKEKSVMNRTRK